MSRAKTELLARLHTIDTCLREACVLDGLPAETERNAAAAMFRSGLAILQFTTVESFIKDRTAEILNGFSSATVSFQNLSEALQIATTQNALEGLLFQAKLQDIPNQIDWLIAELAPIGNATKNISALSKYSFGYSRSNLSKETVKSILGAFNIEGGWSAISSTAKNIGVGGAVDYSQIFTLLAERRHKAAHSVTTNIPINDLKGTSTSIIGLCCAFDLLLSYALSRYNRSDFPSKTKQIKPADLSFRFVGPHPTQAGKFSEQIQSKSISKNLKTVKIHPDLATAKRSALKKAETHLIELNSSGIPADWISL